MVFLLNNIFYVCNNNKYPMGGGGSKSSCRDHATSSRPACRPAKDVDWLKSYTASDPCTAVDQFKNSEQDCLDDKCPLWYTRTSDCVCSKQNILEVTTLSGYTDTDAHKADCCDGTAERHTCESNYCRSSGAKGAGPGCASFMQTYCRKKARFYPQEASTGSKIIVDWDKINYLSDPNHFVFMWQHYPRCACYDEDGQKFDAKRRHVMFRDNSGQNSFVSVDLGSNPANCWFKHCKAPYIYGNAGVCNTAITVCAQFSEITVQGDSNMSPVTLTNNCIANTGTVIADDQTSTTTYQEEETESEADKAYKWLQENKRELFLIGGGGIAFILIMCCCCILLILASAGGESLSTGNLKKKLEKLAASENTA